MANPKNLVLSFLALLGAAGLARAGVTVDQQPLGPDGQLFGGSRSPQGNHLAIFAAKGSHYQIIMDGVEGPKIDNLIFNIAGALYRAEAAWVNMPIPVIFSKDGKHWAYMAKQGDEFIVMLDGKEMARGPINTHNLGASLNLTFSANGQHLFWSDDDAQGNYVIVVDGKPGPAMRTLPQLMLSPDGDHYAYVNYNRDGTGAWTFVDGKQVNFFGDLMQYTPRNVLVSTQRTADGNSVLLLNGRPEAKANAFRQITISPDGKQIAIIVTPQQNAPSILTINGKQVAGTEGLNVEKVYFSPDGNHYAALCDTKTGARFMIIDGKKGDSYPSIAQQVSSAQLVVQNGVGYDTFMNKIEAASPSTARKVIDVQSLLGLPDSTANPHLWYDPSTMPAVAKALAKDMAAVQPAHAAYFQANLRTFDRSLQPWYQALARFKSAYPGTPVAVTEPVGDYMLQAAGTKILTPFRFQADIMNGVDPAPQDIALESGLFAHHTVKVFLYNQQVTDSLTQDFLTQAHQHDIPVVGVYETMPTPGYTYQSWMLAEVKALQKAVADKVSTQKL